jgi:sugar phosphate isomerase/epimerase
MNLGILAHTFGRMKSHEVARAVKQNGFGFVQLALAKALDDFDYKYGMLSPGLANYVAEQFDSQGVRIGVLGCYIDPIHPDPEIRRDGINRFKEHLKYARAFGTNIVATETGSIETYLEQYPQEYVEKGWSVLRQTVEELAEEAERWGVHIGIEPVASHTVTTPELMKRLMEEIPSSNIGVVLDPVNLLDKGNVGKQEQVLQDAFELWHDRIVLVHVKDFTIGDDGRKSSAMVGQGQLNYPLFFELLKQHKPFIDISLEEGVLQTLGESRHFLNGMWDGK